MPQVINTNVLSLNAQRNLNRSQNDLSVALERLSSGLRINSAKDDAAGLAIAERFSAQINGLNQAVRNANDGISLAQTAEGALGESTNILQRVRELAVQSANATNSASDRNALQAEVSQLVSELDRIASTTQFNGLNLLDGSFSAQQFQVGANANQTISVSVTGVRANTIGSVVNTTGTNTVSSVVTAGTSGTARTSANTFDGVTSANVTGSNVTINGTNISSSAEFVGESARGETADSAFAKAAAINGSAAGVSAVASNEQRIDLGGSNAFTLAGTLGGDESATVSLDINSVTVFSGTVTGSAATIDVANVVDGINAQSSTTGVTATFDTSSNELVLTNSTGGNIAVSESIGQVTGTLTDETIDSILATGVDSSGGATSNTATYRGDITLQSSSAVTIDAGEAIIGFASSQTALSVDTTKSVATLDISTVAGANEAILAVDAALDSVNSNRADLGAVQSRFESTIANLSVTSENLSSARSRIEDADFAAETARLTQAQILQQAGISVLSQANAQPQNVLALLQ